MILTWKLVSDELWRWVCVVEVGVEVGCARVGDGGGCWRWGV